MNKPTSDLHLKRRATSLLVMGMLAIPAFGWSSPTLERESSTGMYVLQSNGSTVKEVLAYIEKHSQYVFVYDQNVRKRLSEKVDMTIKGRRVDDILSELCQKTGLSHKISGRQVTISNGIAKSRKIRKISGKITDQNGDGLIGATIKVNGTTVGTVTDLNGNYQIEAPEGARIVVSYIGFDDKELTVGQKDNINITMSEADTTLNELVVIGYGTVKKKDLTGAVAAVKGDELVSKRTTTLSTALQGSLSGVMVRRNNNAPGASASSIHVRGVTTIGDSSPLVIVDGVEGSLDYVNANDVENITVLKDAAAASIYGSKAAAGVILVTTKRGQEGKVSLTYTGELGWEIPTRQPSMVGVTRYMEMNNELLYNDNPTGGYFQAYTADQTKNWVKYNQTDPDNYPITDWKGLMLKDSAPRMTHSVNLSAGNDRLRSTATITFDEVKGLYEGRKFERWMFRNNTDYKISDKLSAALDINVRHAKSTSTNYSPFDELRLMPAVYAATWQDGRIAEGKSGANPYGLLTEGGLSKSHSTQVSGKASLTYKPIKGLSLQAVVAPYIYYQKSKAFKNAVSYNLKDDADVFGGYLEGNGGSWATNKLSEGRNDNSHVTTQFLGNYMIDLGKHSITAMAGFENYFSKSESLSAARDQYELTNYPYLNIGPEDYQTNSGTGSEYVSNSFFGRVLYSYANRYLFQANVRHDGSSRFAKNYRWGTFPSFSAGWVVTEEKFMQDANIPWLSFLKLRASWGKLGNERIGSNYFPYIALMSFGDSYFYTMDGTVVSGKTARPGVLAVEDITWETTTSTDLGFDANFLNNRLRLTFDYYWKKTTDMLLAIEIPYMMGYSNPSTNAGKMSTHGYDIDLSWQDHIGDFKYGVTFNFSDFLSKIDYLNDADQISSGKIKRAGELYNAYYGYVCEGIYQTQEEVSNSAVTSSSVTVGDLKYKDISGPDGVPDGKISPEYDRVVLGNSLPRFQYGGTLNASWRGLDLSVAFQGIGKQNSYLDRAMVEPLRNNYGNIPAIIEGKYWSPFNTDAENAKAVYPRLSTTSKSNNYAVSDFWIFNGAYFRLKNVTLGYTLPEQWTNAIGIQSTRVYFSASDLFCISNYPSGWDPEMGISSYPITTSLVMGIQVKF